MGPMPVAQVCPPWKALAADRHRVRAARVEAAAAGRRDQARDLATRLKRASCVAIRVGRGGEQQLGVGMPWPLDDLFARAALDRLSRRT